MASSGINTPVTQDGQGICYKQQFIKESKTLVTVFKSSPKRFLTKGNIFIVSIPWL